MQRLEEPRRGCRRIPGVLEPARADLGIGPAVNSAVGPKPGSKVRVALEIAVVAEGVAARRIVERLRVGDADRGEARGPPEVDEERGRLDQPDRLARRVVAEGPDVAVGLDRTAGAEPRRAPAEPGDSVPLQVLREGP